jgi:hypothetical protein
VADGNKYDYLLVTEYKDRKTKYPIICHCLDKNGQEHGVFYMDFHHHIYRKQGCPKCKTEKLSKIFATTAEDFVERSNKTHNNTYKYPYIETELENLNSTITCICPKHGEFTQLARHHIQGHGCPKCSSSVMERKLTEMLIEKKIKFEQQKSFPWLVFKQAQYLDFYLTEYNIAIECQGEQHFRPVDFSKGNNIILAETKFELIQLRDENKKNLCEKHNIPLFYINFNENISEKLNEILTENKIA